MNIAFILCFILFIVFIWLGVDDVTNLISFRIFKILYNFFIKIGILKNYTYLYFNIEGFKYINEIKGCKYGDILLKKIGNQMKKELNYFEIASRLVNDNFVLLLKTDASLMTRIEKLVKEIENIDNNLKVRIGYYIIKENNTDWVISNTSAKFACISEQKEGKNIRGYNRSYFSNLCNEEKLYFDYNKGLKNKDFKIYYQGKFDTLGRLRGAEALVRWQHAELGLLSPFFFISMLEKKNEISRLDIYVVEQVCNHLLELQKSGTLNKLKDFKISINLSSQSFKNKIVMENIFHIIDEYNVNPKNIEFELTESSFIDVDKDVIFDTIQEMHIRGFTVALDDFGTGYSSLKVLNNLPIDVLKIDKCFINNKEKSSHIVVSLIGMAHQLGLKIVAEGVEEEKQLNFLKEKNCDLIQGFLFARPIPWNDFQECLS